MQVQTNSPATKLSQIDIDTDLNMGTHAILCRAVDNANYFEREVRIQSNYIQLSAKRPNSSSYIDNTLIKSNEMLHNNERVTTEEWVEDQHYLVQSDLPDLTPYATKSWVEDKNYLTSSDLPDLSPYALKTDLNSYALKEDLGLYALKSELERYALKTDLNSYALKTDLNLYALRTDLNSYVLRTDLDSYDYATKSWVGDQGYLTSSALMGYATQSWVEDKDYATVSQLPDLTDYVRTVNGRIENIPYYYSNGSVELEINTFSDSIDIMHIVNLLLAFDGYFMRFYGYGFEITNDLNSDVVFEVGTITSPQYTKVELIDSANNRSTVVRPSGVVTQ